MRVLRTVKVRIPTADYDGYCREAARTGRTVQQVMYLKIMAQRPPGRPKGVPISVVEFKLPALVLRRFKKRARRERKPLATVLRSRLCSDPP